MKKKIIKPWGYELLIEKNSNYMFKKLYMKKGHRCSLQYHNKKTETIFVLKGRLKIYFGTNRKKLKSKILIPGETMTIKRKLIHRMFGVTNALYLEASTPEILDVIRLSDDYKRSTLY